MYDVQEINHYSLINIQFSSEFLPRVSHSFTLETVPVRYALSGRCAFRNEWIWRMARGIRSLGSFQGYMLTSAFGASIAHSIATLYGCGGVSSGRMSTGFWHWRTKSRETV